MHGRASWMSGGEFDLSNGYSDFSFREVLSLVPAEVQFEAVNLELCSPKLTIFFEENSSNAAMNFSAAITVYTLPYMGQRGGTGHLSA